VIGPSNDPSTAGGTWWTGREVYVLCDAASSTGLGHFVRCTSLASVLAARGAAVTFLLPEDSLPQAVDRARAGGWGVRTAPWDVALPGPLGEAVTSGSVIVVDSYRVDGAWLTRLRQAVSAAGGVLAVIDDLADRSFEADLVLNQNVGTEHLPYPGAGTVLSGPAYALLRQEFPRSREAALAALEELPDVPRRVLVLFGGTDATGMAPIAAVAAARAFPGAEVRVVAPPSTGALEPSTAITRLDHVERIHEEMLGADLVVSAGGTTLWELCCLARPTAVVAVAENQVPTYDAMVALGAVLPAGRAPVRDAAILADRLRQLVDPPGALRAVAAAAAALTDGHGCDRTADALEAAARAGSPAAPHAAP
jgi:spore coat polysaccharide biosynthesis predicted glycosyltransferase SpsG